MGHQSATRRASNWLHVPASGMIRHCHKPHKTWCPDVVDCPWGKGGRIYCADELSEIYCAEHVSTIQPPSTLRSFGREMRMSPSDSICESICAVPTDPPNQVEGLEQDLTMLRVLVHLRARVCDEGDLSVTHQSLPMSQSISWHFMAWFK